MRTRTLGTIRTACQQRADMEDDDDEALIATSEWNRIISAVYGELYQAVVDTGGRYFESTSSISATGAATYTLPTDHLATIGIDRLLDGTTTGRRYSLRPLESGERTYFAGETGAAIGYEVSGQSIVLRPNPSSGSYQLLYVPQSPDLTTYADTDSVDLVTPDGEEFVIWGVAVKALAKQESDVRLAMSEREASRARVIEWATRREINNPHRRVNALDETDDLSSIYGRWNPAGWWNR